MAIKVTGVTVIDDNRDATVESLISGSVQLTGGTGTQGTVTWNADEETLDLIQDGATLQLGQELQIHARNNTGSSIANGTVVMATGTLGASGRITIAPYDNTTDVKYIVGVATEDIANDSDGKVTSFGKVRGINTSGWAEGAVLYTAANGGLTSIEPTTGVKKAIAFVINSHSSNGTLMVRVNGVDEMKVEHGETAYNWGDHAAAGYADGTNEANWNTAYGWGDHSVEGYLTESSADLLYMDINAITLPDQTGHAGQFLQTDGTNADWATVSLEAGGSLTGNLSDVKVQYGTSYAGTPLQGSFFFDSLNQKLKVYTGTAFVDAVPAGTGSSGGGEVTDANTTFRKYTYTLASATNAISGSDDNGESLSYVTDGTENVEVFVNGIKQVEGATNDYVATTGTAVTLTYNAPAGAVVEIQVYEFLSNDAYYLKNEVYTKTETNSQISTALSGLVDSAPTTLDTLNELASALGDDPNFATTISTSLGTKVNKTGDTMTGNLSVGTATLNTNGVINYGNGTNSVGALSYGSGLITLEASSADTTVRLQPSGSGYAHVNGKLAINTTSNDAALYIEGISSTNGSVAIKNTAKGSAVSHIHHGTHGDWYIRTSNGDASSKIILADNGGNVGIGTTDPSRKLHVVSTADGSPLRIQGNSSVTQIEFAVSGGAVEAGIASSPSELAFRVGSSSSSSEVLRMNSDGTVRIGGGATASGLPFASKLMAVRAGVSTDDISFDDENNTAHLTLAGSDARVRLQMGTLNTSPYAGYVQASFDNNAGGTGSSGEEPLFLNPKGGSVAINYTGSAVPGEALFVNGNAEANGFKCTAPFVGNLTSGGSINRTVFRELSDYHWRFQTQGDGVYRNLVISANDMYGILTVCGSDAAVFDMKEYYINIASPAYGVASITEISSADGGWPAGNLSVQLVNAGNNEYALQFQWSSYYNSGNTGTFMATWRKVR